MNDESMIRCRICGHVEGAEDVPAKYAAEGVCSRECLRVKQAKPEVKGGKAA